MAPVGASLWCVWGRTTQRFLQVIHMVFSILPSFSKRLLIEAYNVGSVTTTDL